MKYSCWLLVVMLGSFSCCGKPEAVKPLKFYRNVDYGVNLYDGWDAVSVGQDANRKSIITLPDSDWTIKCVTIDGYRKTIRGNADCGDEQ